MKKKFIPFAYLLATLFFIINIILNCMNLNPLYPETAFFYCFMLSIYIGIAGVAKLGDIAVNVVNGNIAVDFNRKKNFPKAAIIGLIVVWALYFLISIGSNVLFNVNAYRSQMSDYIVGEFNQDIQLIDTSKLPIVDKAMAAKLADKKLGERPSLGSQVVLGEPVIQQVNGELIWAVPTYHSGFFKWVNNLSGTPGYVKVSATNPQNVEYVDGYNLKIQPGAFFFDDLVFHTRFTSALFDGITDYSFELDDTGKPYWVVTTYKYLWGFALPEANGVIVVDCATGESVKYALADVPAFVDRVQPESFLIRQMNNKGAFVHGVFNFSDKDKYQTSDGNIIVYNEGRCYMFTGLTSVGSDESAIGFVMVDMVTKEPTMYKISGATEYSSQKSAEGKVQQYGYYASSPIIVNFGGAPSYFMTLKDDEGLIKQYAYVSIKDYLVVGVGETINDAKLSYEKALMQSPSNSVLVSSGEKIKLSGGISRIASEFNGSETVYFITLDSGENKIFTAPTSLSPQLALTQVGDRVAITFSDGEKILFEITEFQNISMG